MVAIALRNCVYVHIYTYICAGNVNNLCTYPSACTYEHTYMLVCMHIFTYVCTYMHAYAHTYIHP